MVHVQHNKNLHLAEVKSPSKFFGVFAFLSIGFGCIIALYDLMFDPILSALAALLFVFIGSACAVVATAKFLQQLDKND